MRNSYKEEQKVKKYISDLLPYYEIIRLKDNSYLDNAIVQNRNGKIFSVFAFDILPDNMDSRISEERREAYKTLFSLQDGNFSFVFDTVKIEKNVSYPSLENIQAEGVRKIEEKMKHYFEEEYVCFETKLYLSVVMNIKGKEDNKKVLLTEKHISELEMCLSNIEGQKEGLGLTGALLKGDDLYTYLVQGVSNDFTRSTIGVPYGALNNCIANESEFYPSMYPLKIEGFLHLSHTLKNEMAYTKSNMYSSFMSLPFPLRMIIKYHPLSKKESENYLYKKKSEFKTNMFRFKANLKDGELDEDEVNFSSLSAKNECDEALSLINEENTNGGPLSFNILISFSEKAENKLLEASNALQKRASENHFSLKKEKRNNTFAFFSSVIIGESNYLNHNTSFALTDNVSDMIYTTGEKRENKSSYFEEIVHSSVPFMITKRLKDSVYNFSLFCETEVGHNFLTGPTGSGKSITLAHMASEWLKYENTKVVYIDVGLSCLNVVLSNNGKMYYPLGDDTVFAPFHNARDNIDHIISFVESIAIANDVKFTPSHSIAIKKVCELLPYGEENTETFYAFLKNELGNDDGVVLTLYQYVNALGNGIFNANIDHFDSKERIIGIELEKLLIGQSKKIVYPTLTFLFSRLESFIDPSHPTLLILDEAWLFLKDEFFSFYIQNWLKTLRKKNAAVVIATQEIEDLVNSPIASTILQSCPGRIFLKNIHSTENTFKESYKLLGLEDYEVELIKKMPNFYSLIKNENTSEIVSFCSGVVLDKLKTTPLMKKEFIKKRAC